MSVFSWQSSFAQCGTTIGDTVYVRTTNNIGESLRAAINCVNDPANTIRFIHFNIPGAGVKNITPTGAAPLPAITKNDVVIDARTQPGWSLGNVVISPGAFLVNSHGLRIQANNVSIYGLTILGFTDAAAGAGIFLIGSNALISENALIGNQHGVKTDFPISFTISNNLIGVDPVTNAANGNITTGINILSSTGAFTINNNTIAFSPTAILGGSEFTNLLVSQNSIYCSNIIGINRMGFTVSGFTLNNATTRTISGAGPNGALIEVFAHDLAGCFVSAPCQGKTFLGSTTVSGGSWSLDLADGIIAPGDEITATATVGGNNTSEFTACRAVVCPTASINFLNVMDACGGTNSGSATASVSISGTYTYSWSSGQTEATATNLAPNTYRVTATDASSCITVGFVVIAALSVPSPNPSTNGALCIGESLLLDANTNNGTPAYTYNWAGPDGFTSTSEMPSVAGVDLANGGTYFVTVTDQNFCKGSGSVLLEVNALPDFNLSPQNVSCFGEADGMIDLNPIIIAAPETYEWSNGAFTQNIIELDPGTYMVTVTDANNCETIESVDITEPAVLVLSNFQPSAPTSVGGTDGTLDFNINGGTAPYAYSWSGVVNGADNLAVAGMTTINNLPAGDYTLMITDANNCTQAQNFTIMAFSGCMMSISASTVSNISCAGAMDGSIDVTIIDENAPLTYNWSNGAMTEDISNLAPDNYALTVTDAAGCDIFFSSPITEPAVLVLSNFQPSAPTSVGGTDGTLDFDINGGTAPYAYSWSGVVNGADNLAVAGMTTINNLSAGDYTLMITDANNCTQAQNFTIAMFGCTMAIENTQIINVDCTGQTQGSITISITNAMEPLTYNWTNEVNSGNGSGSIITNLEQGTYAITITDQGGCVVSLSLTVDMDNDANGVLNFIQGEEELCQGETLLLSTNVLDAPDIIYHWIVPSGDTVNTVSANLLIENIQPENTGNYTVFVNHGTCLMDETGPFSLNVIGLGIGEEIDAGVDTIICDHQFQLNAAPINSGMGVWIVPEGVKITQENSNNALVTDLKDGNNQFIWMVNTTLCGNIGADTINVVVATGLGAMDDFFTLQQANSEIFMDVIKNDGLPDDTPYTLTALTQPEFGTLITLDNGFQYFETEGQRGTVIFDYEVCFLDTSCPNACATATVTIEVLNLPYLPEGFSPNDDGKNDFLEVLGYSFGGDIKMALSITNRWGDIVYQTDDYLKESPWNGYSNNSSNVLPEATYYAWMEIEVDGEVYQQTQAIYLIK